MSGAAESARAGDHAQAGADLPDAKVSTDSAESGACEKERRSQAEDAVQHHWKGGDGASTGPGDPGAGCCDESNLRDLATISSQRRLRHNRVYRCSQFHSQDLRSTLHIKCILDLRKSAKGCKQPQRRLMELMRPDWALKHLGNMAGAHVAPRCPNCESQLNRGLSGEGVHVRSLC